MHMKLPLNIKIQLKCQKAAFILFKWAISPVLMQEQTAAGAEDAPAAERPLGGSIDTVVSAL